MEGMPSSAYAMMEIPCAGACGTMEGMPCACGTMGGMPYAYAMMGIPCAYACACACATMGGKPCAYACACACATMGGKPCACASAAVEKPCAYATMAETVASPTKASKLDKVASPTKSSKLDKVESPTKASKPDKVATTKTDPESNDGKDCGKHDNSCNMNIKFTVAVTVSITISVSFSLSLTAYLVLRPTKPSFYIQNANIYQFNLSSSADDFLLSSAMLVAVSSLNHNARVGVYYDRLDAHAAYMDQRITLPAALPAGYQGHKGVSAWSPYLSGATLPVTAPLVEALLQEQSAGYMRINVNLHGKLRWKVGGWISGHYHLRVSCPALFAFQGAGGSSTAPYLFQHIAECSVEV